MKIDGWRWRLKVEAFRFWFCFHWIMFFILWELGFHFILSFIWFSFDQWLCLPFTWFWMITFDVSCFFLQPIVFMFWLQNRYKSSILKPKNRFYLIFVYKVDINHVHLNRRTDWDPNPKVYRVIQVLWRFTNPDPNSIELEPVLNRFFL